MASLDTTNDVPNLAVDRDSRAREAALVEYTSLKADSQGRLGSQVTLVGFALTAAAALSAVALSKGTSGIGASTPDRLLLLLVVPLVVNGLGLFFLQHNIFRGRIRAYCRDVLWPILGEPVDVEGFDNYLERTRRSRELFFATVVAVASLSIFTTSDVLALVLVRHAALTTSTFTIGVWALDVLFSLFLIVGGLLSGLEYARPIDEPLVLTRTITHNR